MKKKLTLWKTRMWLFALSLMMCCTIVVYAASHSKTSDFYSWKSTNLWGKLTAEDWDVLMEKLKYEAIPKWAIMAFNLSECPEWWTRYNNANGKMIRGLEFNQTPGSNWGSNQVTLETNNLPQHQHYIRYWNTRSAYWDNANTRAVVVDWDNAKFPWNPEDSRNHGMHQTDSLSYYDVKTAPNWPYWNTPNPINITNLYVALLICQKN